MAEHQDRGKVFIIGAQDTSVPAGLLNEREAKEQAKLKEAKAKADERFLQKKQMLKERYELFLQDRTSIEQVESHGNEWIGPGLIIHLFAPDFSGDSTVLVDDAFFRKVTPYAKVLSVSPYNELNPAASRIKVGDILHMGDGLVNAQINANWLEWNQMQTQSGGKIKTPAPTQYIRRYYAYITDGKMYHLDKSNYVLNQELIILGDSFLKMYSGEFVFELSEFECPNKKVTKNPWS